MSSVRAHGNSLWVLSRQGWGSWALGLFWSIWHLWPILLESCEVQAPQPGGTGRISIPFKASGVAVMQRQQHTLGGFIWLLDLDSHQKLCVHPMNTRVHTQADKALRPPKKKNFNIQLLLLVIYSTTSLSNSLSNYLGSQILTSPWEHCAQHLSAFCHITTSLPARSVAPQVCCCRPCAA